MVRRVIAAALLLLTSEAVSAALDAPSLTLAAKPRLLSGPLGRVAGAGLVKGKTSQPGIEQHVLEIESASMERLRGGGNMKIALCAWESLHSIPVGGVAPHVTELAAGLQRRGHEVHLYTRAKESGSHSIVDGVHVHQVPIELDSDLVKECDNMCNAFTWYLKQTEDYMGQQFDIVHCHDWLAAKALVQLKQAGRKCILTMHSTEFGRCGNTHVEGGISGMRVCMYVSGRMTLSTGKIKEIEREECEYAAYIYKNTHKHTHKHTHTHAHIYGYMYVYTHTHTYVYMYTYAYMYVCMFVCMYVYIYI